MKASTWFGIDFAKCLTYVARCTGLLSACLLETLTWARPDVVLATLLWATLLHPALSVAPQLLTVFIEFMQRFITVYKVKI
jgi:hypothetical protein